MDIDDIISRYWKHLKEFHGVLSVRHGTKFVGGKDTGIPCITVFVVQKKLMAELTPDQVLPTKIDDIHIDVIELKADYMLGENDVSKLSPDQQKRIASGIKEKVQ